MKTTVRSILVENDHGRVEVRIRMPNGDLKRRFLRSLLHYGSVVPQEKINTIMLEVLDELERTYRQRRAYIDKALEQIGVIENINLKAAGEEEVLEAQIEEKDDQIVDLLDELMEAEMNLNDLQAEYAEYAVNHPHDKSIH